MVPNGEEILKIILIEDPEIMNEYRKNYKIKNDPRITKVGKFLRKYSVGGL